MISNTKIRKQLEKALDIKSPLNVNRERTLINWPMKDFRHKLMTITDMPQIQSISFEFTDEDIKNQLTTAVLKSETRTIKLTYDYKSSVVECFCIGRDIDAVRKIMRVDDFTDFVREYFPAKRRVVVVRKKSV